MAWPKGKPRPPNSGRKAGTPNKATCAAKEAFALAFEGMGGIPAFTTWAKANETEFYKLYARLIPVDLTASQGEGGPLRVIVEGVAVGSSRPVS
jgi:hypothetical protein